MFLTPGIGVDVLLTGGPQPSVERREDKTIISRFPGELGRAVRHAGDRCAPEPSGRGTQGLWDFLTAHAPMRRQQRNQRQQQRQQRLNEGQSRRTQVRQKRHAVM